MAVNAPRTQEALDRALARFGLTAAMVGRAVATGAAESRNFSMGAPKSAPNQTRWFRTVESLHGELMAADAGWTRDDPQNLPYFRHTATGVGLVVSSGDAFTGVTFGRPSTKNPKGKALQKRVDDNAFLDLFDGDDADLPELDELWMLLYNERDGIVFVELSRPATMSGPHIDSWSDRIIFPPYDITGHKFKFDADVESDEDEGHGFTIARR